MKKAKWYGALAEMYEQKVSEHSFNPNDTLSYVHRYAPNSLSTDDVLGLTKYINTTGATELEAEHNLQHVTGWYAINYIANKMAHEKNGITADEANRLAVNYFLNKYIQKNS